MNAAKNRFLQLLKITILWWPCVSYRYNLVTTVGPKKKRPPKYAISSSPTSLPPYKYIACSFCWLLNIPEHLISRHWYLSPCKLKFIHSVII
jgi:hypothetical protein